jgi:arylsulfatase A-like enzyme
MKQNIIFILIDGCRADKIFDNKCTSKKPNIDFLIKNGISFTNTFSSVDGTTMSLNCLFNSLYPTKTGLRTKKVILTNNNFLEQLKNNGYHIFGYIPKVSSFNSMIEFFENSNNTYYAGPPVKHFSESHEEIVKIIDEIKEKTPWFYFIHLLDNSSLRQESSPYGIPEFLDDEFGETLYEKMLSSIDFGIGKILEKIDLTKTTVILTSDHGSLIPHENLGFTDFEPDFKNELKIGKKLMPKSTHKIGGKLFSKARDLVRERKMKKAAEGLTWYQERSRLPYFKQSLYDENIHIPLIISNSEISSNRRTELMSNMDIFPTIFDILGIKNVKENIDGHSYYPTVSEQKINKKIIFLHTMPHENIENDDAEGIRTKKYKFFRSITNPQKNRYLYNIEIDKNENNNIIEDNPDIVKDLGEKIDNIKSSSNENIDEISDDEIKKIEKELKKLGYM